MNVQKLDQLLAKVQHEAASDVFIYGVTPTAGRNWRLRLNDFFIDRSRIPTKEKAYFFELLGTLVRAGIPLNTSLGILAKKTGNPRLQRITATLSHELEHGRSLSQGLSRFPEVFDETERGAIRSAEAVGHLENMLFKIGTGLQRRHELMSKLIGALIYPAAVCFALAIAVIGMLVLVVPRIQELFAQSSVQLPLPTRVLLSVSVVLQTQWWLILIVIIFGIAGFHMYTHSDQGRFSWDFQKLRLPYIGEILRKIFVLRFTETLGVLVESGLPINQALQYTAGAIGNEVYRMKTYDALGAVQEGKKLSASLSTAPFLFPETVTNMIAVGEHSATLGEISQKIGAHFEMEIMHTLRNMTTVLGPLLILGIGVTIAFFALAILSPIFSLTEAI